MADPRWSCTRKKAYPTEEVAKKVARSISDKNPTANLHAYGCVHCGLWHIGRRINQDGADQG